MDNIKLVISENTDVLEKYDDICESYKNLNEEGLCIERNKVLPIFLEYKEKQIKHRVGLRQFILIVYGVVIVLQILLGYHIN